MTSGFNQVKWIERIAQSASRKHPGGWRSRESRNTVPDCAAPRQFWGAFAGAKWRRKISAARGKLNALAANSATACENLLVA